MKKVLIGLIAILLLFVFGSAANRWDAAHNRGYEFGYWGSFNRFQNALEQMPNVKILDSGWNNSGWNKKATIDQFGFRVQIAGERQIKLWFHEGDPVLDLSGEELSTALRQKIEERLSPGSPEQGASAQGSTSLEGAEDLMELFAVSRDGVRVHYTLKGRGEVALVFVHGWLGGTHWWQAQEEFFSPEHRVVRIDLAGHGTSGKERRDWSAQGYADDIQAVLKRIHAESFVLVGHSMSGAYVLEAARTAPQVRAVVLVDTLKDLDQVMTLQQAEDGMLRHYRSDFRQAIENLLPQFLFVPATPEAIRTQLQNEFLAVDPEHAIAVLEPLYKMDLQGLARQTKIPVRAINSDATPTNLENNLKYFQDFEYVTIADTGHYPMLEKPDEFNRLLGEILRDLGL
ncbi:MAG: alpha/beta hydrolase [Verrucomicrobiota bacterium]|nr:alpha/beta hydrolase [Verrucomicrobiota bacterium]